MKVFSLTTSLLFILFFSSFTASSDQEEELLKLALEVEKIDSLLRESPQNETDGVISVTNKKISSELNLEKFGEEVLLVQSRKDADPERPSLEIESFKVQKNTASLKFTYMGYTVKIKFRQENGEWKTQSYRLNGNGNFAYENDF